MEGEEEEEELPTKLTKQESRDSTKEATTVYRYGKSPSDSSFETEAEPVQSNRRNNERLF